VLSLTSCFDSCFWLLSLAMSLSLLSSLSLILLLSLFCSPLFTFFVLLVLVVRFVAS